VQRIVQLLGNSDLSILEIAERMQCSKAAVSAVNRTNRVRCYNGRRNYWTLVPGDEGRYRDNSALKHGVIWV
jgi:hypothetical protein